MDGKTKSLIEEFREGEELKGLLPGTVYRKKLDLINFFKSTGRPFNGVTREDVRKYLDRMRKRGLSPLTVRPAVSHIKEFFGFLLEEGYILINPTASIETLRVVVRESRGIFTEDEVRRILDAVPDTPLGRRDRAIMDLLYSSGIRAGELAGLDINDVNLKEREIYVERGKGGSERIVPAGAEALRSLETYLDERLSRRGECDREALFLSLHGGRMKTKDIAGMIRKYKKKAGVNSRGSAHAFRHSCATHMLKNGAPLEMIRRILGHEYLSTTERYARVPDKDLIKVHRRSFRERSDV